MSKITKSLLKELLGSRPVSPRALFIMFDMVQKCESMLMELAFRNSSVEEAAQKLFESMWIIDNSLAHAYREREITDREHALISGHAEMITDCAHAIAKGKHPYEGDDDIEDWEQWINRSIRGTEKAFSDLPPPSKCGKSGKKK
ncbi:hypothetical protein DTO021C3_8758 [Paecilomyces variotii]|nr:hypothetical protein DTO021C3_8758 [Paecilomyces variotii]KAJ9353753.1 hypothetical protein DTO027B9_5196 [Paecilomyces variotii]